MSECLPLSVDRELSTRVLTRSSHTFFTSQLSSRYFLAGRHVLEVLEESARRARRPLEQQRMSRERTRELQALETLTTEVDEVRKVLLTTYSGDRLRRTVNWALSSVGDDVSSLLPQLTEMELRLFQTGAQAAQNMRDCKVLGPRTVTPEPKRARLLT